MLVSHVWLCDHSPPGSSVHGILQARILEWAAKTHLQRSLAPCFLLPWAHRQSPPPATATSFQTPPTGGSALFAANWFLSPRIALTFMLTKIPFSFLLLQWTDSFNVVVLGAGKIKNNNPIWLAETLSRYSLRVVFYCLFVCLFFMEKHPCLNNVKSIWFPAVCDQALSSLPRKPSEIPGCPQLSSHAGVLRRQSGRCEFHDWKLCPIFSP